MPVSLRAVAEITEAIAAEHYWDVERITIASASAEAQRVELLVTLARYRSERRVLLLNLSRREPDAFERQLRARLLEARHQ